MAQGQQAAAPEGVTPLHPLTATPDNATLAGGKIRLDVLVTDAAGKPVTGLSAADFTVQTDKVAQKLVSFESYGPGATSQAEQPVELIIVIDAVNNGFSELAFMRQGLEQFLRRNNGQLAHPVSLVLFAVDGVQALAAPSTDGNALADLVKKMKPHVRSPGIEPFSLSIKALGRIAQDESKADGRKLLIWLGPGWETPGPPDTVMTARDEQYRQNYFDYGILLSTRLRQARITLYGGYQDAAFFERDFVKGVRKVTDEDPRDLSLGVLALQTGGRGGLASINRDSDVAKLIDGFAAEADSFYTLSFNPPANDVVGAFHSLRVTVDKRGLTARTNMGFYGQAAYSGAIRTLAQSAPAEVSGPNAATAAPFVGRPVTVAELAALAPEEARKRDGAAAKDLYELRLTERLSSARLEALQATLPGTKTRLALAALADAAVFLKLPAAETPAAATPDLTEQRRILALAVDYLRTTMPRLPNFFATRTTNHYQDAREDERDSRKLIAAGDPIHWVNATQATVIYRDHREVVDTGTESAKKARAEESGLVTRGTFGPILYTVITDAAHGQMSFSHWEQTGAGIAPGAGGGDAQAVFKFTVPQEHSHYEVAYQNDTAEAAMNGQTYNMDRPAAYHGEIAIDPATGTILRMTLVADIDAGLSLTHVDLMVEYGPVEIGGKTYICPVRSVSLSEGRAVTRVRTLAGMGDALGSEITRLSDVTFTGYHVFRTEMRILTGDTPALPPAKP